uniref:Sodium channel blocker AbNaTx16 n=1 Tax=Androctonus bicolor TaxID=748906 RepID=A0A0K0LBV0_9SCOR|nr:sodium channel blocker AbNaTx16 [Androctonus bicolor]
MKLLLLLTISASMLIEGLANSDGYLKKKDGCRTECVTGNDFCDKACKSAGGSFGYCDTWTLSCWCKDLPDNKIWTKEKNICAGKK